MNWAPQNVVRYGAILVLILIISVFHYETSTDYRYLHEIYQRVYYIPILLAAFWYGPLGGILAATVSSILYIYHIQRDWANFPAYTFNQYAEIFLYHAVALIIGFLSLKDRRHRDKLENTSRELSEAYRELQRTFEHLKKTDRLAALGQLSAGIAHEIRNPLGSIKGSIEILENEIPPDHPKHGFVRIIKEETARLNSIMAEFLKFARPPHPSVEPTSINELIDSTLILLQKQADQLHVEIRKKQNPVLPLVSLDHQQIRQVFLNVLLNGIQAMPDGGVLQVYSGLEEDASMVVVEISDTGKGLDEAELDHVFDPFFTTKPHGTGLGLSISYQLVQNHGGTIAVRKNQAQGLTFRIELPLVAPARAFAGEESLSSQAEVERGQSRNLDRVKPQSF